MRYCLLLLVLLAVTLASCRDKHYIEYVNLLPEEKGWVGPATGDTTLAFANADTLSIEYNVPIRIEKGRGDRTKGPNITDASRNSWNFEYERIGYLGSAPGVTDDHYPYTEWRQLFSFSEGLRYDTVRKRDVHVGYLSLLGSFYPTPPFAYTIPGLTTVIPTFLTDTTQVQHTFGTPFPGAPAEPLLVFSRPQPDTVTKGVVEAHFSRTYGLVYLHYFAPVYRPGIGNAEVTGYLERRLVRKR